MPGTLGQQDFFESFNLPEEGYPPPSTETSSVYPVSKDTLSVDENQPDLFSFERTKPDAIQEALKRTQPAQLLWVGDPKPGDDHMVLTNDPKPGDFTEEDEYWGPQSPKRRIRPITGLDMAAVVICLDAIDALKSVELQDKWIS
ncbi:MAG: hypothetical protein KBD10_00145 [Candidatus Pacebacteria bacterium]|nr:hypothetical protein [Candidatus Paceibacterota bacterium]